MFDLDLSLSEFAEFMEECNIAKNFDHPNVLSILGISFTPEENKPLMVMPYMHHGDVKSYLKSKRGGVVEIEEFPQVHYSNVNSEHNSIGDPFGCLVWNNM